MRRVTPRAMSVLSASVADTSIERTDGRAARAPTVRAPPTAPTPSDAMRNPKSLRAQPQHVLGQERHVHAEIEDAEAHHEDETDGEPEPWRARGVPHTLRDLLEDRRARRAGRQTSRLHPQERDDDADEAEAVDEERRRHPE